MATYNSRNPQRGLIQNDFITRQTGGIRDNPPLIDHVGCISIELTGGRSTVILFRKTARSVNC